MKTILTAILILVVPTLGAAQDKVPAHPHIQIETTEGIIRLELDGRRAPLTVQHFLTMVDSGFYDGTIFHRMIPGFMAQGGGYTPDLTLKEPEGNLVNESGNGLENLRGTIAMARLQNPHTANTQFFINVGDNFNLSPNLNGWGYAVFGIVIEGMDVVDRMVNSPTGPAGPFSQHVPVVPIVIKKVSRFEYGE